MLSDGNPRRVQRSHNYHVYYQVPRCAVAVAVRRLQSELIVSNLIIFIYNEIISYMYRVINDDMSQQ